MDMLRGSWNHLIVILGQPGTGKSTYALKKLMELCAQGPAYGLAHDPGWRLPDNPRLERHSTFGEVATGLARNPGHMHAVSVADGDAVVKFGIECAQHSKTATGANGGFPVMVLLDEGVATKGINPYRLSPQMADFVATRRHHNVGMIVTMQSPSLGHYQLLGLSTEIVMFRLIDERGLKRLETVGVPRKMLEDVKRLPNYHSITYRTG